MNIYFKITTLPATEDSHSKEFDLFYDKYKEVKELGSYDEAFKVFLKEAAKNPTFGRIYSLTVGYIPVDTNQMRIKCYKGLESSIIQEFLNLYTTDYFKGARSVMWNAEFVLPFLTTRAAKNNIKSPFPADLRHFGLKSWNLKCLDLQAFMKGVGWFAPSLEETAFNYNMDVDFVDPETIYKLWKNEQTDLIDRSSIDEVKTIVNLHRILEGCEIIEDVYSEVVVLEEPVKEIELPILERIYKSPQISEQEKEDLKQLLSKKKITKKDKPIIKEILTRLYVNTEIFKADKPEIVQRKEQEIEEIINSL